jgi:hypothetical protein
MAMSYDYFSKVPIGKIFIGYLKAEQSREDSRIE